MKTSQVVSGKKKGVALNLDTKLYHKCKVFAAERDVTITAVLEHLLGEHLDHCKHEIDM